MDVSKLTRDEILAMDTEWGEGLGKHLAKLAGCLFESVKSPGTGLDQTLKFGEGFCRGIRIGLLISKARFSISREEAEKKKEAIRSAFLNEDQPAKG